MNPNRLYYLLILLSGMVLSCNNGNKVNTKGQNVLNDSVRVWIKNAKNKSFSLKERNEFADKSYLAAKSLKLDSSRARLLGTLAYQNLKLGDTLLFKQRNKEALSTANRIRDSFAIGDVHWSYASYYNKIQAYDSAYYHFNLAHTFFDKSGHVYEAGRTQYGMAFIRGRYKDYSGSEVLTFKAIDKFKKIEDYKSLFSCYNHLGALQNDIYEYDRALFYYNKALEYSKKLKDNQKQYQTSLNNKGNAHLKKEENLKAINYFDELLKIREFKSEDLADYARVLSNRSYAKLLINDTVEVEKHLTEALHLRDSINNKEGITRSKIHLAHYYAFKEDTIRAIESAKEANKLSKQIRNSINYLESLTLLSKLDKRYTSRYLKEHIRYSDSIQIVERKIQNKFTMIAFETDEYIEETKKLSKQRESILYTGLILSIITGLIIYIFIQRTKKEKLLLEYEQQKSNEELYLNKLEEQEKLEKEKVKERNRISEELHDGILGKLFGIRLGLGFLKVKGGEESKDLHNMYLEELQIIEKEIREVSNKLNNNFDSSQINFRKIIKLLLEDKAAIAGFDYDLQFNDSIDWYDINEKVKTNLYRILQEAIQNIIKYASATNVIVHFNLKGSALTVKIEDDGIGFKARRIKKGIGIKNMKSRVNKLNGEFAIFSRLEEGTLITIQIPV